MLGVFLALFAALMSSCATWKVAKEQVAPGFKQVLIAVGPQLGKAILEDLLDLIGLPFIYGEKAVNYFGPSDTVPTPTPTPTQ